MLEKNVIYFNEVCPPQIHRFSRQHLKNLRPSFLQFFACSFDLALVAPHTKISKEDIAVATELARAADEAGRTIQKRRRRQVLMDRCAEGIEELCRGMTQSFEGEYNQMRSLIVHKACTSRR